MKMSKGRIGRRLLGLAVAGVTLVAGGTAFAELGQPAPWEYKLQGSASPVMDTITSFHNILLWIITIITLFSIGICQSTISFHHQIPPPVETSNSQSILDLIN